MAKYGKPKETLPIFLGDDLIDEDGFKVINKYGGISVFVGEAVRISAAEYFLRSPAEVEDFLGMLVHKDVSH